MNPREAAEALWETIYKALHVDRDAIDEVERALIDAESRGRAAMREEAAKVCDARAGVYRRTAVDHDCQTVGAMANVADEIRALPTEPGATTSKSTHKAMTPTHAKDCTCHYCEWAEYGWNGKPAPAAQDDRMARLEELAALDQDTAGGEGK